MPSRDDVELSPDLEKHLRSTHDLPAEPSLPRTPSRFGKMQGTRRARTELAYLAMMRTASHDDDHSFGDLIARLKSTGELPAEPSRFSATPSTPKTPSLSERVIHHISRGSSAESSPASTTPSPPRTPSQFERAAACRSAASPRLEEDLLQEGGSYLSIFSKSPRHTLLPPPPPGGEHHDSAEFLARMHKSQLNKEDGRRGLGPALLEGVLHTWESARKGGGKKGVARMMKAWSSTRPPA